MATGIGNRPRWFSNVASDIPSGRARTIAGDAGSSITSNTRMRCGCCSDFRIDASCKNRLRMARSMAAFRLNRLMSTGSDVARCVPENNRGFSGIGGPIPQIPPSTERDASPAGTRLSLQRRQDNIVSAFRVPHFSQIIVAIGYLASIIDST